MIKFFEFLDAYSKSMILKLYQKSIFEPKNSYELPNPNILKEIDNRINIMFADCASPVLREKIAKNIKPGRKSIDDNELNARIGRKMNFKRNEQLINEPMTKIKFTPERIVQENALKCWRMRKNLFKNEQQNKEESSIENEQLFLPQIMDRFNVVKKERPERITRKFSPPKVDFNYEETFEQKIKAFPYEI